MRYYFLIWIQLIPTLVFSQGMPEKQIINSKLTLTAFECAVVSPNEKEAARLFNLGLKAGREFIAFVNNNPGKFQKEFREDIPILWKMSSGPSADFILGTIYSNREENVYKDYDPDEEIWKMRKQNMYQKRNCALIGK